MPCKKHPVDEWIVEEIKKMVSEGKSINQISVYFEGMHSNRIKDVLAGKVPINKGVKKAENCFSWSEYPDGIL